MQLNLREVLFTPGASVPFDFQLDLSDLEFNGEKVVTRPIEVSGTVRNRGEALTLEGAASTVLELVCDRCLKSFAQEMRATAEFLLAETLEDEENDEILLLKGGKLDLDEVFTTAFVLAMESKHLCSEECKGLCPQCGANLNDGPCCCKPEVDPRLAALAQLLDREE